MSAKDVRGEMSVSLLRGDWPMIVVSMFRLGQLRLSVEDAEWLADRLARKVEDANAGESSLPEAEWAWINDDFIRDRPTHVCDRDAGIVGHGRYNGEAEVYVCDECGAVGA